MLLVDIELCGIKTADVDKGTLWREMNFLSFLGAFAEVSIGTISFFTSVRLFFHLHGTTGFPLERFL
jgi:hypothetical protein